MGSTTAVRVEGLSSDSGFSETLRTEIAGEGANFEDSSSSDSVSTRTKESEGIKRGFSLTLDSRGFGAMGFASVSFNPERSMAAMRSFRLVPFAASVEGESRGPMLSSTSSSGEDFVPAFGPGPSTADVVFTGSGNLPAIESSGAVWSPGGEGGGMTIDVCHSRLSN